MAGALTRKYNLYIILVMVPNMNNFDKTIVRRPTTQRELILKAVCEGGHPTAREIFDIVSRSRRMSFGTVYRNLQVLAENGEIICVQTDQDALRYDRRRDQHHHFHCRKCGKVLDIPVPYSSSIDREATENSAFVIESHSIRFEGLCPECAGK
ncbi:MAG: transcriptional repressor [Treponema sp.]|jgi:Fe2+ or Zn2+ uptake regulation protein|nr:transcriptional repressor [Treponema sp.]